MSEEKNHKELKYFLHDLINHTHGLILYLEQKEQKAAGLSPDEIALVKNEISRLQQLIKTHYQFNHRSVAHTSDQLDSESFQACLQLLINTYLSGQNRDIYLTIDPEVFTSLEMAPPLSLSAFQRIMGNLIKNIAENSSGEVHFSIEMIKDVLLIKSRNKIVDQNRQAETSLGLKSISHLCTLLGGEYKFHQKEGQWINKLSIPLQISGEKFEKKAA